MTRVALYIAGISAAVAAGIVYRRRNANNVLESNQHVAVDEAAAMLREAWADHHTVA